MNGAKLAWCVLRMSAFPSPRPVLRSKGEGTHVCGWQTAEGGPSPQGRPVLRSSRGSDDVVWWTTAEGGGRIVVSRLVHRRPPEFSRIAPRYTLSLREGAGV